jgi:hypothetical protein
MGCSVIARPSGTPFQSQLASGMMVLMAGSRRPSRKLIITAVVATALSAVIVYFGLNPDPTVALIATVIFVIVGGLWVVSNLIQYVLLIPHSVEWLEGRRRGGDDGEPANASSHGGAQPRDDRLP